MTSTSQIITVESDQLFPFNLGNSSKFNNMYDDSNPELISPATQFSDVSAYDYNMELLDSIPFVPLQKQQMSSESED